MTNEYVTLSDGVSSALAAEAFTYTYDASGNIIEIKKNGATLFRYAYDSLNQLVREDNRYTGKSYTWKYDEAGNILNRKTYAYTIDALGTVQNTVIYGYDNGSWGDLLISFNGQSIAYDDMGNPGTWNGSALTWQGRRLMSYGSNTYTYNADGIRTSKTVNGVEHIYHLSGTQILDEEWIDGNTRHLMVYVYDASGQPIGISHYTYNGTIVSENYYLLVSNIQGDIIGIYDSNGTRVVTYVYDAWGRILSTTGTGANTIGAYNPFRYRGYYYDTETGFYYISSRYYDPEIGRWINADGQISGIGGDIRGYNLFAYCFNNPVNMIDPTGNWPSWGQIFAAVATVAVAAVFVAAVVASAGAVGVAAGVAAASIGATGTMVSAAITVGTVGTYVVAAGIGTCALSNAGEILTGTNVIRDGLMGGNQEAYDTVQAALNIASGVAMIIGQTNPGVTGKAAKPNQNAQTIHKVPTTGTHNTSLDKLYSGNTGGFQRTYYDFKGNISLQIDFTYHGHPSIHSNPHLHIWGSSGRGKQINLWYLG